jgi:hypothetical protein
VEARDDDVVSVKGAETELIGAFGCRQYDVAFSILDDRCASSSLMEKGCCTH